MTSQPIHVAFTSHPIMARAMWQGICLSCRKVAYRVVGAGGRWL